VPFKLTNSQLIKERTLKRVACVINLAPGAQADYERIHAAVWPEVLAQIYKSNIRNYSIYRLDQVLFSYFEYIGSDYEGDMAAMGLDEKTQEWWALTIPMQSPFPERGEGEWWMSLPEVFHTN
jgi:L-rhamnose mutarotase